MERKQIVNKQLQRQLKHTIVNYKGPQLKNLLENFQRRLKIQPKYTFSKKTINCSQCQLKFDRFCSMGYGRNQAQSSANAIRNLFDSLITQNYAIEQLKKSLKTKENKVVENPPAYDQTLDLNPLEISGISAIVGQKDHNKNCHCVYYEIHEYNKKQITNLQARIKLLNNENIVLKEMLLKGYYLSKSNKENNPALSNNTSDNK